MITNFKDMGDHYLLNGAKCGFPTHRLPTLQLFGQKTKGRIHGLIVERMEGFQPETQQNGLSLFDRRIDFDNVKVPKETCCQIRFKCTASAGLCVTVLLGALLALLWTVTIQRLRERTNSV
jgi:hypothetical protein